MKLVFVKGGCFPMGDVFHDGVTGGDEETDEQPVHEVCLGDFYLGKFEVTQGQWKAVMGYNPTAQRGPGPNCVADDCPVDLVSRDEVARFIDRLNAKGGGGKYRLPTEAEWEYAARSGGKAERFSGGNDVESVSWELTTSGYVGEPPAPPPWARPVGKKAPNGLGLHDMSGNVYEMVSDWYDAGYYAISPRDDPQGPPSGKEHVKRGGCAHGSPGNGRTSRRTRDWEPDGLLGFRLARAP